LQRKFLTKKRGAGLVDNSAEIHGLGTTDAPISQDTYKDEEEAPPSIEKKINKEYVGWGSHADQDSAAVASKVDQRRIMKDAMAELSAKERRLLHLRFVEKLKQKEIAEQMGKGASQIGIELKRAEAKLRKLVADKTLNEKKNLL
jgi:RNA polymerase sigma factor (sigma-70 family)